MAVSLFLMPDDAKAEIAGDGADAFNGEGGMIGEPVTISYSGNDIDFPCFTNDDGLLLMDIGLL